MLEFPWQFSIPFLRAVTENWVLPTSLMPHVEAVGRNVCLTARGKPGFSSLPCPTGLQLHQCLWQRLEAAP